MPIPTAPSSPATMSALPNPPFRVADGYPWQERPGQRSGLRAPVPLRGQTRISQRGCFLQVPSTSAEKPARNSDLSEESEDAGAPVSPSTPEVTTSSGDPPQPTSGRLVVRSSQRPTAGPSRATTAPAGIVKRSSRPRSSVPDYNVRRNFSSIFARAAGDTGMDLAGAPLDEDKISVHHEQEC